MLALSLAACTKSSDQLAEDSQGKPAPTTPAQETFVVYTIAKGEHSADKSTLKLVNASELAFSVRFDSSAVYTAQKPINQFDINKLYGFSDNGAPHQQFSARFGWRWSDGALRLFAYVYNNGKRQEKELGVLPIGSWISCSIQADGEVYRFVLNGAITEMPRASTTPQAKGYLLYPYFGGDEVAPHTVRIEIKTANPSAAH